MESKQIEVTGRIVLIKEEQTFSEKFKKREFVIETMEDYPQAIIMEMVNDKCRLLDSFQIGHEVNVKVNIRGRKWTNPEGVDKYFNTIQAWQIFESIGSGRVARKEIPAFEGTLNELDNLTIIKNPKVEGNIERRFQDEAIDNMTEEDDLPF